ncbi:MAG: hypothetical protein ABGW85_04620 [Sulfurimonas sp.]
MKLFLLLLLSSRLFAFSIESSYEAAHKKALQEEKLLLVFLTKKGLSAASKKLQMLLESKKVADTIEKEAVFVIIYKNQRESYPIELFYTQEYPTLFFVNNEELFACEAQHFDIDKEALLECLEAE